MGKAKDKAKGVWDNMGTWKKRLAILSFFGLLLTGSVERGIAAYNHFATNTRVDAEVAAQSEKIQEAYDLAMSTKVEARIEWLEKQDVVCDEEEKDGNQSDRRKVNCKKWRKELDDKYEELKKLQS